MDNRPFIPRRRKKVGRRGPPKPGRMLNRQEFGKMPQMNLSAKQRYMERKLRDEAMDRAKKGRPPIRRPGMVAGGIGALAGIKSDKGDKEQQKPRAGRDLAGYKKLPKDKLVIISVTPEGLKKKEGDKKIKRLTGGQIKIAKKAPPRNKIDGKDFAVLRKEKAKGREQGLQDEKMKPGKVMKANSGDMANKLNFKGFSKVFKGPQDKGKVATISGVKPKVGRKKYKSLEELRKAKGFKPGESAKAFMKRKDLAKLAAEKAKATRLGKIVLPIALAGVGAVQYLKSKMKKDKPKKKMGGGMMMKRPMGYSKGTMMDDIIKNMGKDFDYQTKIKYRKKSKGAPDQDPMKAYSEAEVDAAKSVKKKYTGKMGGGMMMRPNPVGMKSGKSVKVKCKLGRNKPTKMY
jgi:hypothetical protein